MTKTRSLWLLLAASLCGSSAVAQVYDTHKGFWLSFGAGGGWMGSERSATTYFRMGGTPNSRVHFGGQVLHWWQNDNIQHSSVTATFSIYPFYRRSHRHGQLREWFFKSGLGVATAHRFSEDVTGVSLNVGSGIDLRLNRNFFVTPNVDFLLDFFNESVETSVLFSLGLSWH